MDAEKMSLARAGGLPSLRRKTPKEFAVWLRIGLAEYLYDGKKGRAFPGAVHFIDREPDIAEDLVTVARALGPRGMEALKEGCALALRQLDFKQPRELMVAEEVLRLGARLRVTDMLGVLADKAFRVAPGDPASALYDLAFDAARELAEYGGEDSASCLRHLIAQPGCFRPALAGDALLALTAAAPGEFASHLDLLDDPLNEIYGIVECPEEEARRLRDRTRLIDALMSRVRPRRQFLSAMRPRAGLRRPEALNWWFNTIRSQFPKLYKDLEPSIPGLQVGILRSEIVVETPAVPTMLDNDPDPSEAQMLAELPSLAAGCLGDLLRASP